MFCYYENTSNFYHKELQLPANALAMNLRQNYPHRQASIEVVCVMRGAVCVAVEGQEYTLEPGDVLTINRNQLHRYFNGTKDGLQLMYSLDPSLLYGQGNLQIDLATVGEHALSRSDPLVAELRGAVGQLVQDMSVGFTGKHAKEMDGVTWHAIHMEVHHISKLLLSRAQPANDAVPDFPAELLGCIDFVHGHYQAACTAEDTARACGLNPRLVRRLFQQYLGVAFTEFVNSVRIVAAASLLELTDCSIVDAAADVGLSPSSLYRLFHRETGMTPGEFVNRNRREDRTVSYLKVSSDHLMHIYGRNQFELVPYESLDWAWLTGKKGWHFAETEAGSL